MYERFLLGSTRWKTIDNEFSYEIYTLLEKSNSNYIDKTGGTYSTKTNNMHVNAFT